MGGEEACHRLREKELVLMASAQRELLFKDMTHKLKNANIEGSGLVLARAQALDKAVVSIKEETSNVLKNVFQQRDMVSQYQAQLEEKTKASDAFKIPDSFVKAFSQIAQHNAAAVIKCETALNKAMDADGDGVITEQEVKDNIIGQFARDQQVQEYYDNKLSGPTKKKFLQAIQAVRLDETVYHTS